jgi:nicotinamidase-related amidase
LLPGCASEVAALDFATLSAGFLQHGKAIRIATRRNDSGACISSHLECSLTEGRRRAEVVVAVTAGKLDFGPWEQIRRGDRLQNHPLSRQRTRQAMAWQRASDPDQVRPWFLRGSPGIEIVPELAPQDDEAVLDKIAFSAFEGTPLATILRDCGLISFAIVGIATEIGIDPTIRHGADLGFIPVMVQDACGVGHAEAGQWSVSALTFMGDAIMTDTVAFAAAAANSNRSK